MSIQRLQLEAAERETADPADVAAAALRSFAADVSAKSNEIQASPFEEKVIRILNLEEKQPLILLKEICNEVINKINRSEDNQILTFIADVNHDMETSGRKAKIIDGIIKDKEERQYSSKLLWDLTITSHLNAYTSNSKFITQHKVKERDPLFKEYKKVSHYNRVHSEVLEFNHASLPDKTNTSIIDNGNSYINDDDKRLPIEDFQDIPNHLSDPVIDFEGKKNSSFSLSSIITQNIELDQLNYYFECSVLKNSDENFVNKNNIRIIDQGSDDKFLTAKEILIL